MQGLEFRRLSSLGFKATLNPKPLRKGSACGMSLGRSGSQETLKFGDQGGLLNYL